jgi:hypothetical protein
VVDHARLRAAAAHPGRVGRSVVEDLEIVVDRARHLEDEIGSTLVLPTIQGVDSMTRAMAAEKSTKQVGALASAVARYRGWLELDSGKGAQAEAALDIAAELAEEFKEPTQLAHSRSFRAYAARRKNDLSLAIDLTDEALQIKGVHPILTVYDQYQRAELLALRKEHRKAVIALTEADKSAEKAEKIELPDFGYWYTSGFWGLERAIVLSALGERGAAAREASAGLAALPEAHTGAAWAKDMLHRVDPDWDVSP